MKSISKTDYIGKHWVLHVFLLLIESQCDWFYTEFDRADGTKNVLTKYIASGHARYLDKSRKAKLTLVHFAIQMNNSIGFAMNTWNFFLEQ